jgi:hypothetical protein
MKNTILARFAHLIGIIALTAVIVFSMAACDPEPEDNSGNNNGYKPVHFPETIAGTTGVGLYWDKVDVYGSIFFKNESELDSGYMENGYLLKSKNGDSYTVEYSHTEYTFTAKVGADGKLTISDSSYSSWNGTYTKRAN